MSTITAITMAPASCDAGPAATFAVAERPEYRYIDGGRFEPANAAAHEECRRWNAYADAWNARTASRSLRQ